MTSAMLMDRTGMAVPGMGAVTGMPSVAPMPGGSMVMVPRCTFKFEKVTGGMCLTCHCDDAAACATVHNLCTMLQGGMVSCCFTMNGMPVCTCNLTCGVCKVETTKSGCKITCTSGDKTCCEMIQCCCECCHGLCKSGCMCCVMMNGTPVCCGSC